MIKHFAIQNISGHKSKYLLSPVAILIELVVGSQSEQGADAHPVRVEDLGAPVDPALAHLEPLPVGGEEVDHAVPGAVQAEGAEGQDGEDDVGEHGREPDDLQTCGEEIRGCVLGQGDLFLSSRGFLREKVFGMCHIF